MTEAKKKILICILIVIVVVGGAIYYCIQNNNEDYMEYEETKLEENIEENNNYMENINNNDLKNSEQIVVHIAGQVVNPGVISLNEGARIIDAINASGGTTNDADLSNVNLAYILEDAQKIYIPSVSEKENEEYSINGNKQISIIEGGSGMEEKKVTETIVININSANESELQKIPGIGQAIASKIVDYRKENGKFDKIEDIQKVSGIGESKYNSIKKYICVK